jgi:hypothetical protein
MTHANARGDVMSEELGGVTLCGLPDANNALRKALELLKNADELLNEAMDCIHGWDYYYAYYAIKDREDTLRNIIRDIERVMKKYFDGDV